ncbi:MAG: hypothetical protein LC624_10985, partial [Halobacteriales archaeon]|nr:hypothetical protein [Halobacteriales archaeon]
MANARIRGLEDSLDQRVEELGRPVELFRPADGGKLTCTACARCCTLREGQTGLCGVRGVVQGKMNLYVYG